MNVPKIFSGYFIALLIWMTVVCYTMEAEISKLVMQSVMTIMRSIQCILSRAISTTPYLIQLYTICFAGGGRRQACRLLLFATAFFCKGVLHPSAHPNKGQVL